jgi:hypothetical protein
MVATEGPTTAPYSHVRPNDDADVDVSAGVYRVVGSQDERVTLLRVVDDSGRRVHSGTVVGVDASTVAESFEAAPNPDSGVSPTRIVRSMAQGLYWQARSLLRLVRSLF